MKLGVSSLSLLGAISAGVVQVAGADLGPSIVPGAYIVEWENEGQDVNAFYAELRTEGIQVAHRRELNYKLFKGASFQVLDVPDHDASARTISEKIAIRNLWPVQNVPAPKLEEGADQAALWASMLNKRDEDQFAPHIMTQVDKLHAAGINGTGVRVGIVDTGCDWTHPALGGCFGPGCLVSYGWDLVGDDLVNPVPDPYPQDCIGHGTHVAGIVAAQPNALNFTGAAPGATIGCFRVFGCGDSGDDDVLVAGFFKAFDDGSDIISCSAGTDSGWSTSAYATAVQRIVDAGVPVVVALGNDGYSGMWTAATPASAPGVVGVGAVNNYVTPLLATRATYHVGNGSGIDFAWSIGSVTGGPGLANSTLSVWIPPSDATACDPLSGDVPDLSNKLVTVPLMYRTNSSCTPDMQAKNIVAKGGRYLMLWSSDYSGLNSFGYISTEGLLGAGSTYGAIGTAWKEAFGNGYEISVTFNTANPKISVDTPASAGNFTAPLSSWGPTFDLEVKPQITAPGIDILSTYPNNNYAVLPGTSMATPLISAVYALILQSRGIKDPETLRNLISSTAKPEVWWDGSASYSLPAPVAQQGAGLVQAFDAVLATTFLSVSSFALNDTDNFVGSYSFSINNTASVDVTYKLGHSKATTVTTFSGSSDGRLVAAGFPPPTVDDWATLNFEADEITVAAGASSEVHFTVVPPQSVNRTLLPVYGGYITLEGSNGETPSIPYLGVAGSMRSTPIINDVPSNGVGVYLTDNNGHFNIPRGPNTTFTIPRPGSNSTVSAIYPKLVLNRALGTPKLRVDVVALSNTSLPTTDFFDVKSVGLASSVFPLSYISKLATSVIWGGRLADGTIVPEGNYTFATSALRISGDENNKEDWDFVQSAQFTLKYLS
ncbi:peptidase [Thozetella sp. PMI_491]|nr:peptidase [Thozetella sp. PMI_491]